MFSLVASLLLCPVAFQDEFPSLGTNLSGVSDWTTQWPFVDAFKVSREWVSQKDGAEWGKGEPLDVDAFGNVKSLKVGQFAETVVFSNGHHPIGKYTLLWNGKGEFDAHLGSTLTTSEEGRAEVNVTTDKGIFLMLKKVDPGDPPRNIRLIMPGYEESFAGAPFHPVFLQRMSLYRVLRFMDWGATNNSPLAKWSDRPTLEQATYTGRRGVPVEVMVDLANEKGATAWICVPHMADDEYVTNLASLVKARLRPDLRVAVEYSNECWNGLFEQSKWCIKQGRALKLAEDDRTAGLRYYSQRSVEVFEIFGKVFGTTSRLWRVLSAQAGDPETGKEIVDWKNAYRKADLLAIAPYFGYGLGAPEKAEDIKATGLDGVFASLKAEIDGSYRDSVFKYADLAKQNRLRLVAYEGGQHLAARGAAQDDAAINSLFDEANRDSRMKDTYLQAFKHWRSAGGSLFVHFTDCGAFGKYGRWGTIEYQNQDPLTSFKSQALIQYGLFPDR